MLETEVRVRIQEDRFDQVRADLQRTSRLGDHQLDARGVRDHEDTYFDVDGRLHARGRSLRIRQRTGDIRVPLKRPVSPTDTTTREELENPSSGSLIDVVEQITIILADAAIIETAPTGIRTRMLRDGVFSTLRSLGLRDLFTVHTSRQTWVASDEGRAITEIVLDDSHYSVGSAESGKLVRECRMEIELVDDAHEAQFRNLARQAMSRFGLDEVHESKFDRGMAHYRTGMLHDKLEAKVGRLW